MCELMGGFGVDPAGNIFVGCGGAVVGLDPSGRVRWRTSRGRYQAHYFAFSNGVVYAAGTLADPSADGPDAVWALTPSGAVRWQSGIDKLSGVGYVGLGDQANSISALAAAPDGTLYVATSGYLTAISPDGERTWRYTMPDSTDETDAIAIGRDGRIYAAGWDTFGIGPGTGFLQALTPDGKVIWSASARDAFDAAVITPDGSLYASAGGRAFRYRTP